MYAIRSYYGLPDPDFDQQPAPRNQALPGLTCQRPVGVEPIDTAVEGQSRLMIPHLGHQGLDLPARDIGGVGNHQQVPVLRELPQVALDPVDAPGQVIALGIAPRQLQGLGGRITSYNVCYTKLLRKKCALDPFDSF